jgi:hypothetical protein
MYAGEHWDIARRLTRHHPGSRLWVCSAGYGLVPAEAPIRPYSATFSGNHPDAIPGGKPGARAWWASLAEWTGPVEEPRSLVALARSAPTSRILVAVSAHYLSACRDDVLAAAENLVSPGELSIIAAGSKHEPDLAPYMLPGDARLQHALGGSRLSLNVRIATALLRHGVTNHETMSEHLRNLLAMQPALRRYNRHSMTDVQITGYIALQLLQEPAASCTRLLRRLRDSGNACEQSRFGLLYAQQRERAVHS